MKKYKRNILLLLKCLYESFKTLQKKIRGETNFNAKLYFFFLRP